MKNHQKNIELFMRKAGQSVPDKPSIPDERTRLLRASLMLEEMLETIKGLGISVFDRGNQVDLKIENLDFKVVGDPNLIEICDGIADISVTSFGTAASCGVDMEPILDAVDESNLAKFSEGYTIREDGKLLKPPNWQPPRIKEILEQQGWKS